MKFIKAIRNNWKKTVFAFGAIGYGLSYGKDQYMIDVMMRDYCSKAMKYGEAPALTMPNKVLVLLNPAANKKSSEKLFEKYCEPILHLAGYMVDIIKTDSEGHARRYLEDLDKLPDILVVAGGDGTVSEALTGLLRRKTFDECPIGILPLGETNSIANKIYNFSSSNGRIEKVKKLAESTISVVHGKTKYKDVMKIEVITNNENTNAIYAMNSIVWGAYRDFKSWRNKYWIFGPYRDYASILFNAFGNDVTQACEAKINLTPPCTGCSNCFKHKQIKITPVRWWSGIFKNHKLEQAAANSVDYSKVINGECNNINSLEIKSTDVIINTTDIEDEPPSLEIRVGKFIDSTFDLISKNFERVKSNEISEEVLLKARTIELIANTTQDTSKKEEFYSIDSEDFEVRPIKIEIIPKAVSVFTL